eukprot:jgi/Ulvmu1/2519/UM138_0024.1
MKFFFNFKRQSGGRLVSENGRSKACPPPRRCVATMAPAVFIAFAGGNAGMLLRCLLQGVPVALLLKSKEGLYIASLFAPPGSSRRSPALVNSTTVPLAARSRTPSPLLHVATDSTPSTVVARLHGGTGAGNIRREEAASSGARQRTGSPSASAPTCSIDAREEEVRAGAASSGAATQGHSQHSETPADLLALFDHWQLPCMPPVRMPAKSKPCHPGKRAEAGVAASTRGTADRAQSGSAPAGPSSLSDGAVCEATAMIAIVLQHLPDMRPPAVVAPPQPGVPPATGSKNQRTAPQPPRQAASPGPAPANDAAPGPRPRPYNPPTINTLSALLAQLPCHPPGAMFTPRTWQPVISKQPGAPPSHLPSHRHTPRNPTYTSPQPSRSRTTSPRARAGAPHTTTAVRMLRPTAPPPRYTPLPAAPDEALAHAATNSGHATSRSASIPRSLSGPTAFPSCMTTARSPERTPQAHLTPEDTGTLPLPPLRRSTSLDSTNICQASPPPSGPSSVAPPPPQRPSTQPPPLPRQLSPPSPTAAPIDELVVAHAQQPASEYDVQLSQETHEQVAQEPRTSLGLPKPLIPRLNLPLLAAARGSPSSRLSQQRWGSVPQLRSGVAASDSDPAPSSDMLLLSPPHTTSPPAPPHRLFGHPLHFPTPFLTGSINSTLSPSEPWHTQELYTSSRSLLDGSPSVKARGPEHSAPCAAQPEQALTGGSQHAAAGLSVVCVAFQAAVDASAYRASAECNLDECMSPPADATDTSPATADASCASADENAYPPSDSSADASGMRQERTPRDAGAAPVEGDEAAPSVVSFTRTVTGSSNDSNAENTDEKCSSCPASFMHDQPDTPYHAGALSDSDVRLADRPSGMRTADDVFLECLDISRGLDRVSERLSEQAPSRDSQELPGSPSGTDPVMHASADRDAYNSLADDDSSTEASSVTGGADSPRPSLDKADIEEVVHAHESTDSPIFQETTSSQPAHPGHSAAAAPVEAALAASGDRTSPDALPAAPAACDEAGATGFVVQDEAVLGAPEAGSAVAEDSEPSGSQHSPVQPVDECSDNGIEGSDVESEPKATSYTTPTSKQTPRLARPPACPHLPHPLPQPGTPPRPVAPAARSRRCCAHSRSRVKT